LKTRPMSIKQEKWLQAIYLGGKINIIHVLQEGYKKLRWKRSTASARNHKGHLFTKWVAK
ncbi:MAG: hypothetical protein ACK53Y_00450, partial [bacterium]